MKTLDQFVDADGIEHVLTADDDGGSYRITMRDIDSGNVFGIFHYFDAEQAKDKFAWFREMARKNA